MTKENPSKFIVAMLRPEGGQYNSCPYVIESNHPRFVAESRFDYGFLQIALAEGYNVLFVGNTIPSEAKRWEDGYQATNPPRR
jgi:hypothetical protein